MHWANVTLTCFLASYFLALLLELSQFLHASRIARWGTIAVSFAGLMAHTAYLVTRSHNSQLPPLLSSTHDWLLVLSWLTVVMYLSVQVWNLEFSVGLFILPAVLLMIFASRYASRSIELPPADNFYWWRMFHASTLVIGMTGILVCLMISGMYLVQHNRLKNKRPESRELQLFSLERLSRWNWWSIILSVPLLTLGMATGLFLVIRSQGTNQPVPLLASGFIISGFLWLGMVILFGWIVTARHPSGRIVAWRTMWACGFLLVTLLVLQLFTPGGIHGTTAVRPTSRQTQQVLEWRLCDLRHGLIREVHSP